MPEQQNIEYKSSWHDDYLKWIYGFANAQGDKIYIGKDDVGKVVGIENYKSLMDEIPNKIKNLMGITAKVNLLQEDSKDYIEIIVQPYSVPISLRGRYYCRSGSVKQELTGAALNEFLLKRAAIILFGKNPCRFYPNVFVKIGRFAKDDADLRYQDVDGIIY
jgi:ATP-dependent DNA helicase RecG